MTPATARSLALQLMDTWLGPDWEFRWSRAKKLYYAYCDIESKRIYLSKPLLQGESEEHIRDTVLHEIAHALTPADETEEHGPKWFEIAKTIGAVPVAEKYSSADYPSHWRRKSRSRANCLLV